MEESKKYTSYDKVILARKQDCFIVKEYIKEIFDEFIELKGDRLYGEDRSIMGGIGSIDGVSVTVIGHRKGRTTKENIKCNFGMTSPEGYRKAVRLMEQAQKFNRPVITFVDTPGAYPGMEAEAHGQSVAIAESIAKTMSLRVPVISIITGEGSSGGALAIAAGDSVWMLENSIYSILSPEGFAAIVWKDSKKAPEASEIMKITADDLMEYGLIDGIIKEGDNCISDIRSLLIKEIKRLQKIDREELVLRRYKKYRDIEGLHKPIDINK